MTRFPTLSQLSSRLTASGIRQLEQLAKANPDLISLGPGQPDSTLFPFAEIAQALGCATADSATASRFLQYGPSQGDPELVDLIVERMRSQGVACDASNVLITAGSQQALDLMCQLTVDPGDTVFVQPFTYPGALQVFRTRGAHLAVLPQRNKSVEFPRAKLLYAIADFQNPTGAVLDTQERTRLLALARDHGVYLLEDAPYREVSFGEAALPPSLLKMDCGDASPDQGRTLFLGSFSKVVAPGLRVGWVVGPSAIISRLTLLRQACDLQPSTTSQAILVGLLKGQDGARTERLRQRYQARRDMLDAALQRHLAPFATWHKSEGGFFIWLKLNVPLDTHDLLTTAIQCGVAYVPGCEFCLDTTGSRYLRLSFSAVEPGLMDEAIHRLATSISTALSNSKR